jgi:putative membrane protein
VSDLPYGPRRLHPISMVDNAVKALPGALIGMVGAIGVLIQRNPGLAMLVAFGILLVLLLGSAVSWWRFTYEVRTGEIAIEKGLLSRQRRVIPFDRVRDIAIEQPLLARAFGTARVRIETGGSKKDEGLLDMIELDAAYALRDLVRDSNRLPTAPLEKHEAAPPPSEPVIFAMSLGRVLGSGLLNFSLIFIALAFGALQYLDDLDLIDVKQVVTLGGARDVAGLLTFRTAAILLALLALVGVVSGVIRTLLRDYGFTLTAGETGLRRRRGLLTLSEVVIPSRRTEAARIGTGWLSGWLGWQSLAFQTLGADSKDGGVQVAAPFARPEEVARILGEAEFPQSPVAPMIRPPVRALIRRCGPWLLLAGLAAIAARFIPYAGWAALALLGMSLAVALAWWREGHLQGEHALYLREGLFGRRVWIIPYEKLQTVATRRGPLQRALGLASLLPDTAGAPSIGAPSIADLGRSDAEALAARLLADFYLARARARAHRTFVEPEPLSA